MKKLRLVISSLVLLSYLSPISAKDYPSIIWAAIANDKGIAANYIQQSGNINITDEYGNTALFFAAEKGHIDMVRFLLENGASTTVESNGVVKRAIDFTRDTAIIELLVEHQGK